MFVIILLLVKYNKCLLSPILPPGFWILIFIALRWQTGVVKAKRTMQMLVMADKGNLSYNLLSFWSSKNPATRFDHFKNLREALVFPFSVLSIPPMAGRSLRLERSPAGSSGTGWAVKEIKSDAFFIKNTECFSNNNGWNKDYIFTLFAIFKDLWSLGTNSWTACKPS